MRIWENIMSRLSEILYTPITSLNLFLEASWPEDWSDSIIQNSKFQNWIKSLGITGEFSEPMEGGVGRAYPIGDGYIVKFTTDRKEAEAAAALKGYDSTHIAKVFDVKKVGSFQTSYGIDSHLFAIVQERLNTGVGKKYRIAGAAIYNYIDNRAGFLRGDVDKMADVAAEYLPPKYRNDKTILRLIKQMLSAMYKVQNERGFLTQDTHGANLAIKGKDPAFFDFGRSSLSPFAKKKVEAL